MRVHVMYREGGPGSLAVDAEGCAEIPDDTLAFFAILCEQGRAVAYPPGEGPYLGRINNGGHPALWTLHFEDGYD